MSASATRPSVAVQPSARRDLLDRIERTKGLRNEWVRRQVLQHDRIDILASEVLGYEVAEHHLAMLRHFVRHSVRGGKNSLTLCFRGSGKTTIVTVVGAIYLIVKNPNIRIIIASKSSGNAAAMMGEIQQRLTRDSFVEVFGAHRGDKWNDEATLVCTRTQPRREPTISVAGIDSATTSKHADVILADDLVDQENSRTKYMRAKLRSWLYQTLMPCLEPEGFVAFLGTRYHPEDLYEYLKGAECKGRTLEIPALRGSDNEGWTSAWPQKFSVAKLLERRENTPAIDWDAQMQMRCDKMRGEVFDVDMIQYYNPEDVPPGCEVVLGADLAISQRDRADYFALVALAYSEELRRGWVLAEMAARLTFHEQMKAILAMGQEYGVSRAGVEAVQYQEALAQEIRREMAEDDELRNEAFAVISVKTRHDKVTRAHRLTVPVRNGQILFRKEHRALIDELLTMPDGDHDDRFDALDVAWHTAIAKRRKKRREPNL